MLPAEVEAVADNFPIMRLLSGYLQSGRKVAGATIAWHCHLTWLTALAVDALLSAGAKLFLSEVSRQTTCKDAIEYMRSAGARVNTGPDACDKSLDGRPQVLSDTGCVLISRYLEGLCEFAVVGACEITTSGITRLRKLKSLPLPVVNINNCRLKYLIENFHGVGRELVGALAHLTERDWQGRAAAVVGYGRVGAGAAYYLKKTGLKVTVVEKDLSLRLAAYFDGYAVASLEQALAESELMVTATGAPGLIGEKQWLAAANGMYVFNLGHWSDEVSPDALSRICLERHRVGEYLEEFALPAADGSKKVYLAAGGSPVNVAVCKGGPEPTLVHLTTEILSLEYLLANNYGKQLVAGENPVPEPVEHLASSMALQAFGLASA